MQMPIPNLATALKGPLLPLEKHLLTQQQKIETWFDAQWQKTPPPLYSSVDLRNAGYKLAPVDTNIFPAGFNNLNADFLSGCIEAAKTAIKQICPDVKRLLIIPESHSRNVFYFESLSVLHEILNRAGFETRIGSLDDNLTAPFEPDLPSGRKIKIEPLIRENNKVGVVGFFPCCIVLNNDLSAGIPPLLENITTQHIMPSTQLGWFKRLKSQHFHFYELVATEFARTFDLDPWLINPFFSQCPEVDFMHQAGQACLIQRAESLLKQINHKYAEYQIKDNPFLVIKADAGTYGMAVMMIGSPEELGTLNRKQRTRMSTIKGGKQVTRAFIQEGVPTFETIGDGKVAEPVIYLIGSNVVGGFYRVHQNRGVNENLNAPGMNFEPLSFNSDCHSDNRFYAYSVVARLATLAAGRELAELK